MTIPNSEFDLQGAIVEKLRHVFDDERVEIISETDRASRPLIIVKLAGGARYEIRIFTSE